MAIDVFVDENNLIDKIEKVETMDNELHESIKQNNEEKVKELFKRGASINNLFGMKGTPLCTAIYVNQPQMVDTLLHLGCDINAKDFDGEPPLCLAIRMGFHFLANKLIMNPLCNLNKIDPVSGMKPVHIAVVQKDITTVKLLTQYGCDINSKNSAGNTALHISVITKQSVMAKHLLNVGGSLYIFNDEGHMPIHSSVISNDIESLKLLLGHSIPSGAATAELEDVDIRYVNETTQGFNETPLMQAVINKNIEAVNTLLNFQCDVNKVNSRGESPLMLACKLNCTDIASCLLQADALPNPLICNVHEQQEGFTSGKANEKAPIHEAISLGNLNLVKKILESGGSINVQDAQGYSPLYWSLMKNKPTIANYLMNAADSNGLDISLCTKKKENLLFACAWCIEPEKMGKRLLDLGCDVNHIAMKYDKHVTPLDIAVDMNCIPLVEVLLSNGSIPESVYRETGYAPLHCCATEDYVGIASTLIQWGADIDIKTSNSDTDDCLDVFSLALSSTSVDMAALLLACGCRVDLSLIDLDEFSDSDTEDLYEIPPALLEQAKYQAINPFRLTFLCRRHIVQYFKDNQISLGKLAQLPLPKNIIDFIRYKFLDKYKYAPIPLDMFSDLTLN